jgi:hypothetical protein
LGDDQKLRLIEYIPFGTQYSELKACNLGISQLERDEGGAADSSGMAKAIAPIQFKGLTWKLEFYFNRDGLYSYFACLDGVDHASVALHLEIRVPEDGTSRDVMAPTHGSVMRESFPFPPRGKYPKHLHSTLKKDPAKKVARARGGQGRGAIRLESRRRPFERRPVQEGRTGRLRS